MKIPVNFRQKMAQNRPKNLARFRFLFRALTSATHAHLKHNKRTTYRLKHKEGLKRQNYKSTEKFNQIQKKLNIFKLFSPGSTRNFEDFSKIPARKPVKKNYEPRSKQGDRADLHRLQSAVSNKSHRRRSFLLCVAAL